MESFGNQTSPVFTIVPFPNKPGVKARKKIVCVSKDHAVTIIDLEDLIYSLFPKSSLFLIAFILFGKYRFSSQSNPVAALHFRSSEELLAIECEDGKVNFWQFRTGTLKRTEEGQRAQDILQIFPCSTRMSEYTPFSLNKSTKQTLNVYTVYSKTSGGLHSVY